jgi:hypothetical protein
LSFFPPKKNDARCDARDVGGAADLLLILLIIGHN